MKFAPVACCRICKSSSFEEVLDLGELVSCGFFPLAGGEAPPPTPVQLIRCGDCGLVQLRHDYELDALFRHTYGYRSGLNAGMVRHLAEIVDEIAAAIDLSPGDTVADIGANDGTLLAHYGPERRLRRVAIDPTIDQFAKYYPTDIEQIADFFSPTIVPRVGPGSARVITSISMFYDLPDPNGFVAAIKALLAPDGVWILEQSYLPLMVERLSFDTICHEHLEYYALGPIDRLVEAHGLRIVDVSFNDTNGGSFRLTVRHRDAGDTAKAQIVAAVLASEAAKGYGGAGPLRQMVERLANARQACHAFFAKAEAEGKLVHGYAASTKGNTLLQHFGVTQRNLKAIADVNPEKWGRTTPGTLIPIVSEEDSRAQSPDYYFVLAWHFRDGFIARERAFLERGGKLVFPLPVFEVVGAD